MWLTCGLSPKSAACEFRWRPTWPQKGRFNANDASASGTRSVTAATHPYARHSETRTRQGRVRPQSSSLNAAAAGATTLPTIAAAVSGRRQNRPLHSARKRSAATRMASPHACRHPNRPQLVFHSNRRNGPGWINVVRGGLVVKAKTTKESTLNPSGAVRRTTGRAAPAGDQSKTDRPGAPVVLPQPPQPKHTDSSPHEPQSQSPL
jgi:hypothetical protein